MNMLKVATMLLASASATRLGDSNDDKDTKLSQSFASAFNMEAPKLMTTKPLPQAGKDACPDPGQKLTSTATGGAFLDGCYMNTTRSQDRNEATGEEAQSYLYMWKHACAFTKWVPSNQFMYSNLDYDAETMTLERFGFIGMEKRCFWGSIGILWKRPLPVEQILPNTTLPAKPLLHKEGQLGNLKFAKGDCLGVQGDVPIVQACKNDGSDVWQEYDNGEMIHKASGKCLATTRKNNGTPIRLADCNGSDMQGWHEHATKNRGAFVLESNAFDGQCVDLPGHSGNRGLKTQMWGCRTGDDDNFQYTWL